MAYQVLHLIPEVGYPSSRGTPWPGLMGVPKVGYPPVRSDRGYQGGVPPGLTGGLPKVGHPPAGGTPQPGPTGGYPRWGTPLAGYPPGGPGRGTPPTWTWPGYPPQVWTYKQSETITSRLVLRKRSVIN